MKKRHTAPTPSTEASGREMHVNSAPVSFTSTRGRAQRTLEGDTRREQRDANTLSSEKLKQRKAEAIGYKTTTCYIIWLITNICRSTKPTAVLTHTRFD